MTSSYYTTNIYNNEDIFRYTELSTIEYNWNSNTYSIKEKIIQLNFQLVRIHSDDLHKFSYLRNRIIDIFETIIQQYNNQNITKQDFILFITYYYKLLAYTRDIICGKGEYYISIIFLSIWNKYFPLLAQNALQCFVKPLIYSHNIHPYGSWKDIKYLYDIDNHSTLVNFSIQLINTQIKKDLHALKPSLAAKWIPRQTSKYKKLFEMLAYDFFHYYITSAKNHKTRTLAKKKAKQKYRIIISCINKKINTLQILLCNGLWQNILHKQITTLSLHKYKYALLNQKKNGNIKNINIDRKLCSIHTLNYINDLHSNKHTFYNKQFLFINIHLFIKDAIKIIRYNRKHSNEALLLDFMWNKYTQSIQPLTYVLPIIDISFKDNHEQEHIFYTSIGLAIFIAQKSLFTNYIILCGQNTQIIQLPSKQFIYNIEYIFNKITFQEHSNIDYTFDIITDTIITSNTTFINKNIHYILLSNMQMQYKNNLNNTLCQNIKLKFHKISKLHTHKHHILQTPYIYFWNISFSYGFPATPLEKNIFLVSGHNYTIINNLFYSHRLTTSHYKNTYQKTHKNTYQQTHKNSWHLLTHILDNQRYKDMEIAVQNFLCD